MKQHLPSQEILLVTGTTFSSRQFSKSDESSKSKEGNEADMLQEACWNGFIAEMLPELVTGTLKDPLYLWKVHVAQSFIELEFGKTSESGEKYFSIDPYNFIEFSGKN